MRSSQFKPVVTASVGHNKVGSGITADGLNAEVQIETEVSSSARVTRGNMCDAVGGLSLVGSPERVGCR